MPRPSKWKSKTTSIRVPEHTVEQLLAIARQIDSGGFVQNSPRPPTLLTIETAKETERYLIESPELTADESIKVDQALAKLEKHLKGRKMEDRLYVAAKFAQRVGRKI